MGEEKLTGEQIVEIQNRCGKAGSAIDVCKCGGCANFVKSARSDVSALLAHINALEGELNKAYTEVRAVAAEMGAVAVRVCEEGGPEDVLMTLAVSVAKQRKELTDARTQLTALQTENKRLKSEITLETCPLHQDGQCMKV